LASLLEPQAQAVVCKESYAQLAPDIRGLLPDHWRELALFQDEIPLAPDWGAYERGMAVGLVHAWAVRDWPGGDLIGYAIFQLLRRHAHYDHAWAVNDILWVRPDRRNLGIGNALCDAFERGLAELVGGPVVIHIDTKAHAPELAALLESRGYGIVGASLARRITPGG
jgi:GNAT superfamily N-acetyltransferase